MAHELTFEQIQKCKKVFDENKNRDDLDRDDAKMPVLNIPKAMKDLDFEMSQNEIENVMNDLGLQSENTEDVDFPTFLRIAAIKFKQKEFVSALEEAFKSFDKDGKDYLSYEELKTILTDYGPKLSNEEADNLLKELNEDKTKFKYKEFVKKNF
jgi:calmodulin